MTTSQLASALEISTSDVEDGLDELESQYLQDGTARGLRLQRLRGRVQLTTAGEVAPSIERFFGLEAVSRLSRAALEALAIVAYKEPVTRPYIDSIRGVHSDGVLRSLLSKGLIQEVGRADTPGRPILYSTTTDFLQHFGLNSLSDLPPMEPDEETSADT